jgi:hypothetical protein
MTTPAPWLIDDTSDSEITITAENGDTIAIIPDEDFAIDNANAKLIAAAPDLLQVLQMMAEKDFEFSDYECRLARMAIAKALGNTE